MIIFSSALMDFEKTWHDIEETAYMEDSFMLENAAPRFREENRICTANLILTLALLAASGTISFLSAEPVTGWLMVGCTAALISAFFVIRRLEAGIVPKALLSALCQPPLIFFLMAFEKESSLLFWLTLTADIVLTGAYFRLWVTLPQFLLSDLLLVFIHLWQPFESLLPFLGFQLTGVALLLTVWRGNLSWKKSRYLAEELDSFLELFGDLYLRLQQGFDRTLVRLEQIREHDELLSECSAALCGGSEPVLTGIQEAAKIMGQLQGESLSQQHPSYPNLSAKPLPHTTRIQLAEAQKQIQKAQSALEQNQKSVAQVVGILRSSQGDLRAIQTDAKTLEHLTKQLYGLLYLQKESIQPANG